MVIVVYKPAEAAQILKLSTRTVYDYLREGKLPGRKIADKTWRILEEDLKAFVRGDGRTEKSE